MKKKLYYVVEKQLQELDGVEETTGWKEVTVYDIFDGVPEVFAKLDLENEESTEECIQDYLDDNGLGDDDFDLIQL